MNELVRNALMGTAGGKKSTYVDDLFSTYLYSGNSTTLSVNNGVDNTKGGMIWFKPRTETERHMLFDTERGTTNYIQSNSNAAQTSSGATLTSFDDDGYTLGASAYQNNSGRDYASWNFRKEKGFFDIVTYTGNSQANRVVTHNLGSVPGCIMIKKLTGSIEDWRVYHRGTDPDNPGDYYLRLNQNHARNDADTFMDTIPTSTQFLLNSYSDVNANGETYVAYIFAGGESTAATARSVAFDGSSDFLNVQSSSTDLEMGSSDFTLELWINSNGVTSSNRAFLSFGNPVQFQHNVTGNAIGIFFKDTGNNWFINNVTSPSIADGTWNHVAVTRSGNTWRLFLNGTQFYSGTHNVTVAGLDGYYPSIGAYNSGGSNKFNGNISNLRFVKGTAVYTSSFRPPYEPLTNITNTKLLCCNNSSTTGSTVTPATIYAGGSPTASTDSPFDDPEGFKFGEDGDQNLIKCGYYKTDSNEDADAYLGWEPQWILAKRIDSSSGGADWLIYDSFRGLSNAQDIKANSGWSESLVPNSTGVESSNSRIGATSTGIYADQYGANRTFVYMAIRRPDGYVGKPVEVGTNAFNVVYGNSSSSIPNFTSNFPVDMGIYNEPTNTYSRYLHTRLVGPYNLKTDSTSAQAPSAPGDGDATFDANAGWGKFGYNTDKASWMWKRHAGCDVVTYDGNGSTKAVNHSLGRVPEMIWIKARNDAQNWLAYHKGLNGGTTPWNYYVLLNDTAAEAGYSFINQPTATHFTVTSGWQASNKNYVALLFASVDGISKCGYYDGTGYTGHVITTGFTPRLLIIKKVNGANSWFMYDSLRGLGAGADPYLQLENTNAQASGGDDVFATSSTGFTINQTYSSVNASGGKYIYYAHA